MSKLEEIKARWAKAAPAPWKAELWAVWDAEGARVARTDYGDSEAEDRANQQAIAAAPTDVAWLVGEVERLTKAIDRAHVQAKVTADRVNDDWLPVRFTESERGQNFCIVIGALWTTLEDAKAGKVLP